MLMNMEPCRREVKRAKDEEKGGVEKSKGRQTRWPRVVPRDRDPVRFGVAEFAVGTLGAKSETIIFTHDLLNVTVATTLS